LETNIKITVHPAKLLVYNSEYAHKLKTAPFKEAIRINPEICVYRHWETTQVAYPAMPLARFPV